MNTRIVYLRDFSRTPVGCVAYCDLKDGRFAYGVSFLNEEMDKVEKQRARKVAEGRLAIAVSGINRDNCQGRFGAFAVGSGNINDKVSNLLTAISKEVLHRNEAVRNRMRGDILHTVNILRSQQQKVA